MKQIKNIIYVIVSTLYKKEIFHINKFNSRPSRLT